MSKNAKAVLSRYSTSSDFATQFNLHNSIARYIATKTQLEAINTNTIKLREISQAYGDRNTSNWIAAWLVSLCSYMNFEINPDQAKLISMFILEELYMLNIVEFTLFFKKLQKGDYGTFYGKINGQLILIACKRFRAERGKLLVKMTEKELKKLGY